jgi:hypothetical protein
MSRLTRVSVVFTIRPVKKTLPVTLGALMLVVGAVWTFQGLGYLEGSPMTGVAIWAVLGPLVAGFGLALMIVGVNGRR